MIPCTATFFHLYRILRQERKRHSWHGIKQARQEWYANNCELCRYCLIRRRVSQVCFYPRWWSGPYQVIECLRMFFVCFLDFEGIGCPWFRHRNNYADGLCPWCRWIYQNTFADSIQIWLPNNYPIFL